MTKGTLREGIFTVLNTRAPFCQHAGSPEERKAVHRAFRYSSRKEHRVYNMDAPDVSFNLQCRDDVSFSNTPFEIKAFSFCFDPFYMYFIKMSLFAMYINGFSLRAILPIRRFARGAQSGASRLPLQFAQGALRLQHGRARCVF